MARRSLRRLADALAEHGRIGPGEAAVSVLIGAVFGFLAAALILFVAAP